MCCEWHALTLVVVNDLYVVGVALPEYKANTPTCVQGQRSPLSLCSPTLLSGLKSCRVLATFNADMGDHVR
jgi:hypothetical protein